MKSNSLKRILGLAGIVVALASSMTIATAVPFQTGDVFAGVGTGFIKHFDSSGNLIETLDTGTTCSEQLGMAFDSSGNLYATSSFGACFGAGKVVKFDNAGNLLGPFGSGYSDSTESIAMDAAQNVYVGQPDGTRDILKFDSAGNPLAAFNVATENRGSDWIDLAADQCTMFYTSEGTSIKRYDVCTSMQLADFVPPGTLHGTAYALRILPDGGLLVADSGDIHRLDSSGNITATYDEPSETSFFFALNVDPDGQHFWTAGYGSGNVYKFAIAPAGPPVLSFNAGILGTALSGLSIFGEPVAALGSISGMKFNDLDGDGIKDMGELGLANWTITLTMPDGSTISTMTDANGNYVFGNLVAGTYTVGEVMQAGWVQTAPQPVPPGTYTVTLAEGEDAEDKDFGNMEEVMPPAEKGRMTGGGSVFTSATRVTYGFELKCDASDTPNSLEINWGKGNKFHLESLTTATCTDDMAIDPEHPAAGFDTYEGNGMGRYNGMPGATAHWIFTDAGEPGSSDTVLIHVWDASGSLVLEAMGSLNGGNNQAHK